MRRAPHVTQQPSRSSSGGREARVERGGDGRLVDALADEDELLPAVAAVAVEVLEDRRGVRLRPIVAID